MNMQERIRYDADELIRTTEQALDDLRVFQYEPRYRSLLGDSLLRKMSDWDRNIRARKDDPFTIVVCGEFKRGKSSLINALLGEDVVPTSVTPETVTINRVRYGAHANEAILSGGRRLKLSDEEVKKENLEKLILNSKEPITQLEICRPLEILKNVTIIDTPGLNDASRDYTPLVEQALQQADAVIYVSSVQAPISLDEALFLRTMILPQRYTDLFVVANYADTFRKTDDYANMQEYMSRRVSEFVPGQNVILLSALDEMCRILGEERPNSALENKLAAGFDKFRSDLEELIKLKKDAIIPDRIHRLTCGMELVLKSEMEGIEAGLELDVKQARERSEEFKEEQIQATERQRKYQAGIQREIADMCSEAKEWINDLLDRMSADAETLLDVSADKLKKYYTNYCIDTIQEAIDRCRDYHLEKLYDELDEEGNAAIRDFSASAGAYGFRFVLNNKTWTKGDNVGYIASQIPQLGLLSIVVDGIAGTMREKEISKQAPQLIAAIRDQYSAFRTSALNAIDKIYENLNALIQKQLSDYYSDQAKEKQEQKEQLVRVAQQSEVKKAEIRSALDELKSALQNLSSIA